MKRPPVVRLYGLEEDELIVDSFAGGGGASLMAQALVEAQFGINAGAGRMAA